MHYQLRAPVQSKSLTVHPITVETPRFKIIFESEMKKLEVENKVQFKNFISISSKIEDYEQYLPKFTANANGKGSHAMTINETLPVRSEMLEMLHYIESMGTFWFGIRQIDLNKLEEKWLPDSEEERQKISLHSLAVNWHYPIRPEQIDPETFVKIIAKKKDFDYLTVPLAFYRVGESQYENFNYYLAFFSFYLFLDSLFGEGKFKTDHVVDAFKKNTLLRTAIEKAHRFFSLPQHQQKKEEIEQFFAKKNKKMNDIDHVIEFLVETRGELFHFSMHDSRQRIHILNQKEFQPIAFLILMICVEVVVRVANDSTFRNHLMTQAKT